MKKQHDEISFTFGHEDLVRIFTRECELPDGFMLSEIKGSGSILTVRFFQSDVDEEEA